MSRFRDKEITLVEIGIHNGGSLHIWKKYLPKAKIIGIDINEDCKRFEKDGFIIEIGNQNSEEFWENFKLAVNLIINLYIRSNLPLKYQITTVQL